jgi:hypothetical protein
LGLIACDAVAKSPGFIGIPHRAALRSVNNPLTVKGASMSKSHLTTRRRFLAATAAGLAAPLILDAHVWAQDRQGHGPSGRINLGFIGIGMMGRDHLGSFLGK